MKDILIIIYANIGYQHKRYYEDLDRGRICITNEEALQISFNWSRPRVLNSKLEKMEICRLTRKTKIDPYEKLRFMGRTIELLKGVEYLGVILDRKLNWKEHAEITIKKVYKCWPEHRRGINRIRNFR